MISAIVALLGQLIPMVGTNSGLIDSILNTLVAVVPALVDEYEALLPEVKNIISALSANPATTAAQLATLQALDAQVDAAFEAAAVDPAADAADAVSAGTASTTTGG